MINAKELMLGNYVDYRGEWILVRPNDISLLYELERARRNSINYNPIQLTPEVLEKAGFEINEDNYAVWEEYRIYCVDSNVYFLQAYYGDDQGWIQLPGNLYSLHQLQNVIFALTGEGLPIKL